MINGTPARLSVGAADVEITPADVRGLNAMGADFEGVHDGLHARAIVIESGGSSVAIVSADLLEVGMTVELRARISVRTGIPASAVLIVATHSHNAPRVGRTPAGGLSRAASAESIAYTATVFDALAEVVATAQSALRPASVGVGRGLVDVNVNRDVLRDGRWMLGQNPDGPSDKTLTTIAFRSHDGASIATMIAYAVHPTVSLGIRQLSADLAGAATSAIDDALGGITMWLPGSLGDQAVRRSYEASTRSGESPTASDVFAMVAEQALTIADEAVRIVGGITDWTADAGIGFGERTVPCPPKRGVDLPPDMVQADVDHVDLRLTALTIGSVALLGVGGEVTTPAAAALMAASPAHVPVVVSLANERLGYLADEEAFARGTFAARGCPIAQGWVPTAAAVLAEIVARGSA